MRQGFVVPQSMGMAFDANGAIGMNYKLVIAQLNGQCLYVISESTVSAACNLHK